MTQPEQNEYLDTLYQLSSSHNKSLSAKAYKVYNSLRQRLAASSMVMPQQPQYGQGMPPQAQQYYQNQ